ncbi:MAG: DNA replication and repair protein RecF [Candidatus Caenarcaniphilales bacterium]|nr:DNA replication and repair protein RecF [Candidatus Caenarcaniphilales bacterium]
MSLFIERISLWDFRNYRQAEFNFLKPYTFVIGANASGKSNLIEAIQAISYGSELRAESEKQLIHFDTDQGFYRLEGIYRLEGRNMKIELAGGSSIARQLKINQVSYRSRRQAQEILPKAITFRAKQSLEVVAGSPGKRRDWLDTTLGLIDRTYTENLERYERALEQRNCLLRESGGRYNQGLAEQLEPWSLELVTHGVPLQVRRAEFLERASGVFAEIYSRIASSKGTDHERASLHYQPEPISSEALEEKRAIDLARGQTTIGPQRDDFAFLVNRYEAKYFASQGQQRSCALALALAQAQIWGEFLSYAPILLLDDIAAELDLNRQNALFANLPQNSQIFLTTTHLIDLPKLPEDSFQILKIN